MTDLARRTDHALRASAVAAFAYAALQLVWGMRLDAAISVIAGMLLWQRNRTAGALVGLYGAWRLVWVAIFVYFAFSGTSRRFAGPGVLPGQFLRVPFAIVWVIGGLAVLRESRRRGGSAPADETAAGEP